MDQETRLRLNTNKDKLALILAVLFVGALAFASYKYFNIADVKQGSGDITLSTSTTREPVAVDTGSNPSGAQIDLGAQTPTYGVNTITPFQKLSNTYTQPTQTTWIANNYNSGDIQKGSYTVKSGDTLWEIAEAVYGNGADWVKILNANSSSIGYLPNGQQALIMPGQILVLP